MSKNNQILLEELVRQELENCEEPMTLSDFFEFYSSSQILKSYELSYDEIQSGIVGKSLDGGADSIYLFINGDLAKEDEDPKEKYKKNVDIEMIFIQSKYENSFGEDALLKLSRLCKNLFDFDFVREDYEKRYNDSVLDAFELFRRSYLGLITKRPRLKISFYYASKGIDVHPNVSAQGLDLIREVEEKLPGAEVSINFIDADKLVRLAQERPNDVFRLKVSEAPMSTSEQVFIALTRLSDYFRFITDSDGRPLKHIFESNVRDYQGKTDVNIEIQDTLENPGNEEFWWLNNGVTILASEASAPGGNELVIHNPEIVNGLQTSSEIQRFFAQNTERLEKDARDILIRVIVPENEKTRDRIIRATNSQTPIPKASLRATDQIHRQIEEFMRPRGLYYDRRKNFYKNEGKKPKDIISVPFLAQCLMSVLMQKPNYARARPSTLLEDDGAYDRLFHKNNDLTTYYLIAYFGRRTEQFLKSLGKYTSPEINDIRFYVLYAAAVKIVKNLYPANGLIAKIDLADMTNELLSSCANLSYDLYMDCGGSDKAAKGATLIDRLKEKLRTEIEAE